MLFIRSASSVRISPCCRRSVCNQLLSAAPSPTLKWLARMSIDEWPKEKSLPPGVKPTTETWEPVSRACSLALLNSPRKRLEKHTCRASSLMIRWGRVFYRPLPPFLLATIACFLMVETKEVETGGG